MISINVLNELICYLFASLHIITCCLKSFEYSCIWFISLVLLLFLINFTELTACSLVFWNSFLFLTNDFFSNLNLNYFTSSGICHNRRASSADIKLQHQLFYRKFSFLFGFVIHLT